MATTTLIRDGSVLDGSGAAAFDGHVLLDGERIAAVVRQGEAVPAAEQVIDASGHVVAPGFIDMHSHVDWLLASEVNLPVFEPLLAQGITTVVAGNCGISPSPAREATTRSLEKLAALMIEEPLDYAWGASFDGFLERVAAVRPPVNVAQLVGHASLRYACSDTARGDLAPDDLDACLTAARRAFDDGACGLSLGLGYDPGMYSSLDELAAFAGVAAAADKPLTVHVKALSRISPCYPPTKLGAHNVRALEEILQVARTTGVRLQLSHFLFVGRRTWRTAPTCLRLVEDARRDGVDVMIDAFPFTCGNTTIDAILPSWFLSALPAAYHRRWTRAKLRLQLELGMRLVGFGPPDLRVMHPAIEDGDDLCGLTLVEVAQRWGMSPFAALLELSERSRGAALMLLSTYSGAPDDETALEAVLGTDCCLFQTDAVLRSSGHPNPAALGTFPRLLGRYVRERRLLDLTAAVHRMTGASADRFGLTDRGRLAPGLAADVVVFDPRTVSDHEPDGQAPAGPPTGIEHVFVNGAPVVTGGVTDPATRTGRVLRA